MDNSCAPPPPPLPHLCGGTSIMDASLQRARQAAFLQLRPVCSCLLQLRNQAVEMHACLEALKKVTG